eukprot:m.844385 g.844385  ORF g.844385 m.844385 type:complete len:425 (-) comp23475_c0_seq22:1634-2908(-)
MRRTFHDPVFWTVVLCVFVTIYNMYGGDYEEEPVPAAQDISITRRASETKKKWDSKHSVVIGVGVGYGVSTFEMFIGSLRGTGYRGHIIMGIAENAPKDVLDFLDSMNVETKIVTFETCTFRNYTNGAGLSEGYNRRQKCAKGYPLFKIQWGRFSLARDWLQECTDCTDGVIFTDVRDAYFQTDPFQAVKTIHPVMVSEEHPLMTTEHWLVSFPVKRCKGIKLKESPMLCSGSTIGTREGMLAYFNRMEEEMYEWMKHEKCRFDLIGDDQSMHDYLFYTGQLKGAVAIPHRTGPIHVVGKEADVIFRAHVKRVGNEGKANGMTFYDKPGKEWYEWLDPKLNLTDDEGYITNLDGSRSGMVHQFDRFGHPFPREWYVRRQTSVPPARVQSCIAAIRTCSTMSIVFAGFLHNKIDGFRTVAVCHCA